MGLILGCYLCVITVAFLTYREYIQNKMGFAFGVGVVFLVFNFGLVFRLFGYIIKWCVSLIGG